MSEEMALMFASIIKGTLAAIFKAMELAGATKEQMDDAVIKARDEMAGMDPSTLPKQA
jgi:hypothetical protein